MIRTGIGYDVHQLAKGELLTIGGVDIPSSFGSVGHSDGDALIHAVVDALLGASALGDIGQFFPSNDDTWKGASSSHFLADTVKRISEVGFQINNIDATIILQKPKLEAYIPKMKYKLAYSMQIKETKVTLEKLFDEAKKGIEIDEEKIKDTRSILTLEKDTENKEIRTF